MNLFFRASALTMVVSGLVLACGDDGGKPVRDASCSSSGKTFTEDQCKVIGEREDCDVINVKPDGSGCTFDKCMRPPTCA